MQVLVVVNSDNENAFRLQRETSCLAVMHRPNVGMNIGAWSDGYRHMPDFDYYLFLKDECIIENGEFIDAYTEEFKKDRQLGMPRENINPKWLLDGIAPGRAGLMFFLPSMSLAMFLSGVWISTCIA